MKTTTMIMIENTVKNIYFSNGLTPVTGEILNKQLNFAYQNMKLSEDDWKFASSTINMKSFGAWLRHHATENDVFDKAIKRYGVAVYYFRNMMKSRIYFNLLQAMK